MDMTSFRECHTTASGVIKKAIVGLAFALIFCALPIFTENAYAKVIEVSNQNSIHTSLAAAADGDVVKLTGSSEMFLRGTFSVGANRFVTLDLNGRTLNVLENTVGSYTGIGANAFGVVKGSALMIKNGTIAGFLDTKADDSGTIILNSVQVKRYNSQGSFFLGHTQAWIVNNKGIESLTNEQGQVNPGVSTLNPVTTNDSYKAASYNYTNSATAMVGSNVTWAVPGTLQATFNKADSSTYKNVILLKDLTSSESSGSLSTSGVIFDLGGYTINNSSSGLHITNTSGTITMRNGTISAGGLDMGGSGTYAGTVNLSNLSVTGTVQTDGHTVNIDSGTYGAVAQSGSGTVTISGGTVSGNVSQAGGGSVSISGGTAITGKVSLTGSGNINISGNATIGSGISRTGSGTVNITGGKIKGDLTGTGYKISAGLFSKDPTGTGGITANYDAAPSGDTTYPYKVCPTPLVKYNTNGGTAVSDQYRRYYNQPEAPTTSRVGYTFGGWYTNTACTTTPTTSALPANDTRQTYNLYAKWTPNVYTVNLNNENADDGQGGTSTYYVKYDAGNYSDSSCTSAINAITPPKKDGYVFAGYYTQENSDFAAGGTRYIKADGTIESTKTTFNDGNTTERKTTLYAYWLPQYTVTYDLNYDSSTKSVPTINNGNPTASVTKTCTVPFNSINPDNRTGYTFEGWSLSKDGTVLSGTKNAGCSITDALLNHAFDKGPVTLYAKWSIVPYTISYEPNGGTSVPADSYVIEDGTKTAASAPRLDDHVFVGWQVTSGAQTLGDDAGNGLAADRMYQSGQTIPLNGTYGNVTLSAQWIENEGVEAISELLTIPAGTFKAEGVSEDPEKAEAIFVQTYLDGSLKTMGAIDLYQEVADTEGTRDVKKYSLAGEGGVYEFSKTYTESPDEVYYKVYVNGKNSGVRVKFGEEGNLPDESKANIYYYSANVENYVNGVKKNAGYVQLKRGSESPVTLTNIGEGLYTYQMQVDSLDGDTAEECEYKLFVDNEDTGKTVSFKKDANNASVSSYTVQVTYTIDDVKTDAGSVVITNASDETDSMALVQKQAGEYTGWAFESDKLYKVYIAGKDTGKTVGFSNGVNSANIEKYQIKVETYNKDGSLFDAGTVTLKDDSGNSYTMVRVDTGLYVFTSDVDEDTSYRVYVNGADTKKEAKLSKTVELRDARVNYYGVTYDVATGGATGSAPVDNNSYISGTKVVTKVPSGVSKGTAIFHGWNTKADMTGEAVSAGSSFTITENTTLFANWQEIDNCEASWKVEGDDTVYYGTLEDAIKVMEDSPTPVSVEVKKDTVIKEDVTLGDGDVIIIAPGVTLTIDEDTTFTNEGGKIVNNGTIDDEGTLINDGEIDNNGNLHVDSDGKVINNDEIVNRGEIEGENTDPGSGKGTIDNNGTIDNGDGTTQGKISDVGIDNNDGRVDGGVLEDTKIDGGHIDGDVEATGDTVFNDVVIDVTGEVDGGTYTGDVKNEGTIKGNIEIGEDSTHPGTITNTSTGTIGSDDENTVVDNTNGTIRGGSIGDSDGDGSGTTTVVGGKIEDTTIENNATVEDAKEISGTVTNNGKIEDPEVISGTLTNKGELDVTGDGGKKTEIDGTLKNDGNVNVGPSGEIDINGNVGGKIENNRNMDVDGTISGNEGSGVNGTIENKGYVDIEGGSIEGTDINSQGGSIDGGSAGGEIGNGTKVTGGNIDGNIDNNGTISGATIKEDSNVTGGEIGDGTKVEGTLTDPEVLKGNVSVAGTINAGSNTVIENGSHVEVGTDGKVEVESGDNLIVKGDLTNNGEVDVEHGGNINIDPQGSVTNNSTVDNSGVISGDNGGAGSGSAGNFYNNGTLENENGVIKGTTIDNKDGNIIGGQIGEAGKPEDTQLIGGMVTVPKDKDQAVNSRVSDVFCFDENAELDEEGDYPTGGSEMHGSQIEYLSVRFDMGGHGAQVPPQTFDRALPESARAVTVPATPTAEGFTFLGWYDENGRAYDFVNRTVLENFTLYAKWKDNSYVPPQPQPKEEEHSSSSQEPVVIIPTPTPALLPIVEPIDENTTGGRKTNPATGEEGTEQSEDDSEASQGGDADESNSDDSNLEDTEGEETDGADDSEIVADTIGANDTTGNAVNTQETKLVYGDGEVVVSSTESSIPIAFDGSDTKNLIEQIFDKSELKNIKNGESVEIRIAATNVTGKLGTEVEKKLLEDMLGYSDVVMDLKPGAYYDLSLEHRYNGGEWERQDYSNKAVTITVEVPKELRGEGIVHYIIYEDKSGVHMLYDEDDDPNTITITTNFFGAVLMADSKMAVSELIKKGIDDRNKQNSTECGLCGWCSKPLGICVYIWIVILVALAGAGYVVYKKLKGNNRKD